MNIYVILVPVFETASSLKAGMMLPASKIQIMNERIIYNLR